MVVFPLLKKFGAWESIFVEVDGALGGLGMIWKCASMEVSLLH